MARIMQGFWICALVLSSSFARNVHYDASSTDVKNKSQYNGSDSHNRFVDNDTDVVDNNENFEELSDADENYDFGEAFEKYKKNMFDVDARYGQVGELGQQYSLRPGGIKFDPQKNIDPEEYVKKWKGNLLRQRFGPDLGTSKPGTMVGPFSQWEIKQIVDMHNAYRTNYTFPSGNTEFMSYSEDIATYAESIVLQCIYENIVIPNNNYSAPFGKNVFIGSDPEPSYFLWQWYKEIEDFDFLRWKCKGKECGHMTQMLWATTNKVGCARQYCWPGDKVDTLILCLYYPPGNIVNDVSSSPVRGYIIGEPCTKCLKGTGTCFNKQCVTKEYCEEHKMNCTCDLICQNCGVKNDANCTCTCAEGWDYTDCSVPCQNNFDYCNYVSDSYCDNLNAEGMTYCRERCAFCNPVTLLDNTSKVCCDGIGCNDGEVLSLPKCECQKLCPNIDCYETYTLEMELLPSPSSGSSVSMSITLGRKYAIGLMFLIAAAFSC